MEGCAGFRYHVTGVAMTRPTKHGYTMSSAERSARRWARQTAVLEAASAWRTCWRGVAQATRGLGFDVASAELDVASVRLDAAVSEWLAYRGKGQE